MDFRGLEFCRIENHTYQHIIPTLVHDGQITQLLVLQTLNYGKFVKKFCFIAKQILINHVKEDVMSILYIKQCAGAEC